MDDKLDFSEMDVVKQEDSVSLCDIACDGCDNDGGCDCDTCDCDACDRWD